jgi:SAM-dependent methyltransferase
MSEQDRQRWNARYRERPAGQTAPSPFLVSLADRLPASGRALDVAGGAGVDARWLARRGLRVTLVDIADAALEQARAAAEAEGLTIETVTADLDVDPLPAGPYQVITCFNFLDRRLFAQIPSRLDAGGVFVFSQPTRRNLERHEHPGARFLLEEGELPGLVSDLWIVSHEEGWFGERHEARLVARRR